MPHSILEDDSTITSETVPSILNTLKNQVRNKQVDRDEQIDQLETEIRLLRRQIPRLKTLDGKDVALELMLLGEAYDKKRYETEKLQAELERCRKYFAETNKRHSNTVKEHDRKLQSLRQEFEHSILHDSTKAGKTTIEQAQDIVAAEYQSRIDALILENKGLRAYNQSAEEYEERIIRLNEELEALRAENKQYSDERMDLAEQKEIDEENQKRYEEMEAYYMNEVKKRDDTIVDLKRLITVGFPDNFDGRNLSPKEIVFERLKIDLQLFDPEWESNNLLREQIEKLVNSASDDDGQDTVSQLHDRIANERSRIRIESHTSSSSEEGIPNTTARDVHGVFIQVSNFKKMLQPLIFHLKKLPQFLEGVEGIPENAQFHELLRQITSISIDLDATVNDVTVALADLEEFERTMNRTPSPSNFIGQVPPTNGERATTDALLNEVKSLRAKLQEEITLKRQAEDGLHNAKDEIDRLTVRVEELVDEKISLQTELKELEDDFNLLKKEYDDAKNSSTVEVLSKALNDAKNSIKTKSKALGETIDELEDTKKKMIDVMKAYNDLKEEADEMNKALDERTDEVNILIDECERMKQELENQNPGSSRNYTAGKNIEEHQRLTKNINALKKDNAQLLNQNRDLQAKFGENEKLLNSHDKYMKALLNRIFKNDPTVIECPPFITERVHTVLIDRIDSSGPKVVEKFETAYKKLVNIKNSEDNGDANENSISSNPPIANSVVQTLDEVVVQLKKCRDYSNEIVTEIKRVTTNVKKLDLEWLLQKNRQIRNTLHLSSKALEAKKERIEDGASLPDIIGELGKIHNVLDDANRAGRVLRSDEVAAKGRRYRH